MKVGLLDIGSGNIFSLISTLKKLNIDLIKISSPEYLDVIDILLMPGVGAFNTYMNVLNVGNFSGQIHKFIQKKDKKILGICVGMQVLFELGEENGLVKGLGIFPGKVKKNSLGLNIGYKEIHCSSSNPNTYLKNTLHNKRFYFTHGYSVDSNFKFDLIYKTVGQDENYFAFFNKDNIYGCQFHPELSGEIGQNLLASIFNI